MRASLPIPRPGVRFGAYPEQTHKSAPWPWYFAEQWRARMLSMSAPSGKERKRFLREVHDKRASLHGCDIAFISASAKRLRPKLVIDGMRPELVAEVFALIDACAQRHLQIALHDAQFLAGWMMLDRYLVEMQTGEGKTLAVALAAATGALAGIPVHVVTANDYLAQRDAASLQPVFQSLGLTAAAVTADTAQPCRPDRYRCDITYCTAKELAFDYLRDRLASSGDKTFAPVSSGRRLRGLCMAIVDEADSVLIDEARMPLILSDHSTQKEQAAFYRQALFLTAQLNEGEHYELDHAQRMATLTTAGKALVHTLSMHLGDAWRIRRQCEEMACLALAAQHLFLKGRDYLVHDKQVVVIDETTGRLASGRMWSRGLHQLIETKERCPLTALQNPVAQTTFQRFFSRYLHLSGISGTLAEDSGQLLAIYRLPVVRVPLHLPDRRRMLDARVLPNQKERWAYVIESVRTLRAAGRPVLIGTDSVGDSEELSACLSRAGLPHAVLNARFDAEEAQIVAAAGQKGAITVSTNMAGRGTDIRLGDEVAAAGGLHVIVCQANDSRRLDRQLYGRCARQGDPGSVEHLYSAEDAFLPMKPAFPERTYMKLPWYFTLLARLAQRLREHEQRRQQWYLFVKEWQRERQMAFAGEIE